MVKFNSKITSCDEESDNENNYQWWNENPMTYDWENKIDSSILNNDFFKNIDNIFAYGHSLVNNPYWPNGYILENFIAYPNFNNKKVLEIGCGAGLVSSHLVLSGAKLDAIDITVRAIELTKKRFKLQNLIGKIIQMNAENILFKNNYFDYVVSWGVIHHSGNMIKIIDEIYRVLKPDGEAYIMVYNKNSLRYKFYCFFWLGIVKMKFLTKNLSQIAGSITDGYIARHLTNSDAKEAFKKFKNIDITYSDEVNTISMYLFGPFNKFLCLLSKKNKRKLEVFLARKFGWYMQIKLTK